MLTTNPTIFCDIRRLAESILEDVDEDTIRMEVGEDK